MNQNQQKSNTPLTPADEAWNKMAELLDSEMPVSDQKSKKRAFTISFSQFAISVVAAMIFVGGGTFITLKTIENKKEIHTSKNAIEQSKFDSIINKTVQSEDSAISAETDIQTSISTNQKENEEEIQKQQHNNNQTSLSTVITQINTPQKVVSVKKTNLNNVVIASTVITKKHNSQKVTSVKKPDLTNVVAENNESKTNKPTNKINPIENQHEPTFTDSVNSQNHQPNSILPLDENLAKVELEPKIIITDSFRIERNSLNTNLPTKEKIKKANKGNNYPKTNHLFIGLSGYNGLLFSKNTSKNIYSYGEILTIGIRNTKYNLAVETGIGFQSLEYRVPYSRTLYTYQASGIYDSTITVSSYKYSRQNIIIPIFITKEIFHYNNIFLDVKTGINTSVFLSKQRLFNQLPADIQLVEDSYPISNLNFSFAISPQFRWNINERFSLNINAGGVFYLNSLYQNYSLKPNGIDISAGLHYLF